jgi:hypothetical protein
MRVDNASPNNRLRRRASAIAIASTLCIASSAPMAAIVDSGFASLPVPNTLAGLYLNLVTGVFGNTAAQVPGWDFNAYGATSLSFFGSTTPGHIAAVVATAGVTTALAGGATIGPASTFANGAAGTNFHDTATHYVGIQFTNEATAALNYGYVLLQTTSATGYPATVLRYVYENAGAAITIPVAPVFLGAASRKVHGAAGTFDLPLSAVTTNPTTEPRQGPSVNLVFHYDKPMTLQGHFTVVEGVAAFNGGQLVGNDVVLNFTLVNDQQYLTVTFADVFAVDGGISGTATVRLGLLAGDVNQNRAVSLADLGLVNAELARPVTAANYLKDVNASGTLTLSDKGITNTKLTHSLPLP